MSASGILGKLRAMTAFEALNRAATLVARAKTRWFYRRYFASIGARSVIYQPMLIVHPEHIHLGAGVCIRKGARLETVPGHAAEAPQLVIGNNVNIEQNVHLVCGSRIIIGDNVSITGGVAIVDVSHPYQDVDDARKVGDRIACRGNYVEIGDDVFIGYGAIILPNVRIGKKSVVGAYAVVNADVPPYSVVAGNPAKVVRQYCFESKSWVRKS
jgi:acetyltransferase-like isoleucine patch superfamily enzyme